MMIAYITAQTPFGRGEVFVLGEMSAMLELGVDLVIIPRNPSKEIFHKETQRLLSRAIWLPLFNRQIFFSLLCSLFLKPQLWKLLWIMVFHSRSLRVLAKNLAVLPKGIYIAHFLEQEDVEHIHAHWGSTTATMAYVASQLAGIPWSVTLHRWDIAENNMLREKVEAAEFVRCISKAGRRETLQIVGCEFENKIKLIHMGVKVPCSSAPVGVSAKGRDSFTIVCPANLVEVKGHRFLVDACSLLFKRGNRNFQCLLFGEGPLAGEIRDMIQRSGLEEHVKMPGSIPHEKLMEMYNNGESDVVVLPSIKTERGDKEGIPVALMEAMAYGLPTISTNTGGIPELLSDEAGLIVEEQNPKQLADAIAGLIGDRSLARKVGQKGYEKVKGQFDSHKCATQLLEPMKRHRSSAV